MLQTLNIKNVALIKSLSIDFGSGLNILLGETGAGKSIIFDSLNFALGAKPDKTLLRSNEIEMRVEALFTNINSQAKAFMQSLGFDDEEILISRTLNLDGKSAIRINGQIATQSLLKQVGSALLDSYSQHESIELLNSKNHLQLLDRYDNDTIAPIKENLKVEYANYNDLIKKINSLGGDKFEREHEKSLLNYQITEIEQADIKEDEDIQVKERLDLMNSSEKIFNAISSCQSLLSDNGDSCLNNLDYAISSLASVSNFDSIASCHQRLESAKYEIEDIYETLADIKSNTEFDEREYEQLDLRYDTIKNIFKKYGGTYQKVQEFLSKAKARLNELEDSDFLIEKYQKEKKELYDKLFKTAKDLSATRKKIALIIENKIKQELSALGMKSSIFNINFNEIEISSNGIDKVEFVFSANLGQQSKSLAKTASGGELSRFMLAFKNIFSENESVETLIFDEIDAGISGETGVIVGEKLSSIKKHAQIICITHLPQVASFGDDFYFVSKSESDGQTYTHVKHLEGDEIVYNLAKMISGQVSSIALSHAQEMRDKNYLIHQ